MSEAPDETTTPDETPDETTPDVTPDTEPTPDEEEEEAEQAEQEAIARVKAVATADIPKKIERAVGDQRKRLEKIIGVELEGSECPTCGGMGYTVGGADPEAEMVHPDHIVMCEACNGYGQWITGSRNELHILAQCIECAGFGYKTVQAQPQNVTPITPTPTAAAGPVMGFRNPDGSFTPFGVNTPQTVEQSG